MQLLMWILEASSLMEGIVVRDAGPGSCLILLLPRLLLLPAG